MNAAEHPLADYYRDLPVVVTGGLGFIGSNVALRLAEAGARVTVIDSEAPGCGANPWNLAGARSPITVVRSDISDAANFTDLLKETAAIFNLAGEISHSRSMEDPERDLALNTVAQLRFLKVCQVVRPGVRVVYAGTRQVYGKPEYLPVDEKHPIRPVDFNGIHKRAAEQYHLLLSDHGALDAVVLRLSNVYGPRMALHLPQQGFLGTYVRMALGSNPVTVYGEGEHVRDPVYVDDVVEAFLRAGAVPSLPSRVMNIGGPEALSVRQIATEICRQRPTSRLREIPFPEGLRNLEVGSYMSDTTQARAQLNWSPLISFKDGVQSTLAWYTGNQRHYLPGVPEKQETASGPPFESARIPVPPPI